MGVMRYECAPVVHTGWARPHNAGTARPDRAGRSGPAQPDRVTQPHRLIQRPDALRHHTGSQRRQPPHAQAGGHRRRRAVRAEGQRRVFGSCRTTVRPPLGAQASIHVINEVETCTRAWRRGSPVWVTLAGVHRKRTKASGQAAASSPCRGESPGGNPVATAALRAARWLVCILPACGRGYLAFSRPGCCAGCGCLVAGWWARPIGWCTCFPFPLGGRSLTSCVRFAVW